MSLRFKVDGSEAVLEAVGEGAPWNGWATPIVTARQFEEWVEAWREENDDEHFFAFVDSQTEQLTFVDLDQSRVDQWDAINPRGVPRRVDPFAEDERRYRLGGWVWTPAI